MIDHASAFLRLWDEAAGVAGSSTSPDAPEYSVLGARLARGEGSDWQRGQAHVVAGIGYRDRRCFDEAHAHFRAAFAHTAPELGVCLQIGAALIASGDHRGAERVLERTIAGGGGTVDVFVHYAHALWGQSKVEPAIAACGRMMLLFPTEMPALETAVLLATRSGAFAQALAWSRAFVQLRSDALQNASAALLQCLVDASLGAGSPIDDALDAALAASARRGEAWAAAARATVRLVPHAAAAWTALVTGGIVREEDDAACRASADIASVVRKLPASKIAAISQANGSSAYARGIVHTDCFARDGFDLPYNAGVARRGYLTTDPAMRHRLSAAARRIQLDALAGAIRLHSPFGGLVSSTSSTILNYHPSRRELGSVIAYFFEDPQPAFALFASEDFFPVAWYDPCRDIILRHDGLPEYDAYLIERVGELKSVWLAKPMLTARYIRSAGREGPRPVELFPAIVDYISTHAFAELQGLLRLVSAQRLSQVDTISLLSGEPLGAVEALIPELRGVEVQRLRPPDIFALNDYVFAKNILASRVTGGFVTADLARRLLDHAASNADPDWQRRMEDVRARHRLLLFVSLRSTRRRWIYEPGQVARVLTALAERHPGLAVIFDGFSVGDAQGERTIAEGEKADLLQIAEQLDGAIEVEFSVGRSMSDALYAAEMCDFHLSEQGTSTTKAALIAGKPGVVLGPRQFGWDARAFRYPAPVLATPWRLAEDLVEGDIQTDFRIDPEIVLNCLLDVADTLPPNRGASRATIMP